MMRRLSTQRLQSLKNLKSQFETKKGNQIEAVKGDDLQFQDVLGKVGQSQSSQILVDLAQAMQQPDEISKFKEALVEFRSKKKPIRRSNASLILDRLLALNEYDYIFDLLRKRFLNGVYPQESHLTALMAAYAQQVAKEKTIEKLDRVYQIFALVLYHHIPPTPSQYTILIKAGLDTGLEEGIRRSVVTAGEQVALGWPLDATVVTSLKALPSTDANAAAIQQLLS